MTDFRLKDDDQREYDVWQERAQQPIQRAQFSEPREVEGEREHGQADQHGSRARAANQREQLVNKDRDQQNIHDRDQRDVRPGPELRHAILTLVMVLPHSNAGPSDFGAASTELTRARTCPRANRAEISSLGFSCSESFTS